MAAPENLDNDDLGFSQQNIDRMERFREDPDNEDTLRQILNRQNTQIAEYNASHIPIEVDGLPTFIVERGGNGNCFFYSLWSALTGNDLLPYFISRLDPNDNASKIIYLRQLRQLLGRPTRRELNEFKTTLTDKYIDTSEYDLAKIVEIKGFINNKVEHYIPPADIVGHIEQAKQAAEEAEKQLGEQAAEHAVNFNPTRNTFNTMLRNYMADYQPYIDSYSDFYRHLRDFWPPVDMPVENLQNAFETILFLIAEIPHTIEEFIRAAIQTKRRETLFTLDEFIVVVKNNIRTNGTYTTQFEIQAIRTFFMQINQGCPVSIEIDILSQDSILERLPERFENTYYIYLFKLDVAHYQEVFLINDIEKIKIVRDGQQWISFEDWNATRARFQRNRTRRNKQLRNIQTQGSFLAKLAFEDQKIINDRLNRSNQAARPRNIGNPLYTISKLNKKELERLNLTSESTEYDKGLPLGSPLYSDLKIGISKNIINKFKLADTFIQFWTQCAIEANKYDADWKQPDVKPENAEPDWNINPSIRYYWWKEIRLTYEKIKHIIRPSRDFIKLDRPISLTNDPPSLTEILSYRYKHPVEFVNNQRYFFGLGPLYARSDQELLEKARKLIDPTFKWRDDNIYSIL
jgi:hypothetical protein